MSEAKPIKHEQIQIYSNSRTENSNCFLHSVFSSHKEQRLIHHCLFWDKKLTDDRFQGNFWDWKLDKNNQNLSLNQGLLDLITLNFKFSVAFTSLFSYSKTSFVLRLSHQDFTFILTSVKEGGDNIKCQFQSSTRAMKEVSFLFYILWLFLIHSGCKNIIRYCHEISLFFRFS